MAVGTDGGNAPVDPARAAILPDHLGGQDGGEAAFSGKSRDIPIT